MPAGAEPLAKVLSRQIVEALVMIGLTQEDILQGSIEFTDLPWQVPPLVVEATLFGVPLSDYIDTAVYVNTEALANLWSDSLAFMKNSPAKVLTHDGFRAASMAIPSVKLKERALYLSVPEGFPGGIADIAAVMLSLECAHIMRANSKLGGFVSDENNYFALLPSGLEVGVKDGLPTMYAEIWDTPVEGMVQEMLRTARGTVSELCHHDIIAKVRSVAYTFNKGIRDYEAVEWALQALRVIDGGKFLLDAVYGVKKVIYNRKVREEALKQAVHVVDQLAMTDRQRIETLKQLLVPEVLTSAHFTKLIYPFNKLPPPVLAEKVLNRIRQAVAELHHQEELLYAGSNKPARSV